MPSFERMPSVPLTENPLVPLPAEHTRPANDTEQEPTPQVEMHPTASKEVSESSSAESKENIRARYEDLMARQERIRTAKRKLDEAEQYVTALIRGFLQTPKTAYAQWYEKAYSTLRQLPGGDLFPQDRAYAEQAHAFAEGHIKDLGLRDILAHIQKQRASLDAENEPLIEELMSLIDELNALPKDAPDAPVVEAAPASEPGAQEASGVRVRPGVEQPPDAQQAA